MKKWIITALSFLLLSLSTYASALGNSNFTQARSIIENWFSAMKNQQLTTACNYMADQFTSLHTDGITRDKLQELKLIKNLHMQQYVLSNFKFKQSDDIIIVTFKDKGIEKIDNHNIGAQAAGRLAVLQKQGDSWLIVAYANMDSIH